MIRARKSLGQNFLTDERIVGRIIETVSPRTNDIIIEIGPGQGALTQKLVTRCGYLVAIEIDERLIEHLREIIADSNIGLNIDLIRADALEIEWREVISDALLRYKQRLSDKEEEPRVRVVANLPYYISTPILERLLGAHDDIFDMTLMLQREVVDRIISEPGSRDYGYMSVFVQFYCEASKLFDVPPSAFKPVPGVWSSVLRLTLRNEPVLKLEDHQHFFQLVGAAFAQRRKTIQNNLKASASRLGIRQGIEESLTGSGIDPRRRAETLSLEEFGALYHALFDNENTGSVNDA